MIVVPSAVSWWALERSARYAEHARLAHKVLEHHLRLAERGQRLLRYIAGAAPASGDREEARLRSQVAEQVTIARAAIADEVALLGPNGSTEEIEELERLDAITHARNATITTMQVAKLVATTGIRAIDITSLLLIGKSRAARPN